MNIFYLNADPKIAAQQQCDKHVVKMILETAQLLSTAHRELDGDDNADANELYKATHKNHPSAVWARDNSENYDWLWQHMDALLKEYTARYHKTHKTERLLHHLWEHPKNITHGDFTPPPQCMPDQYKSDCTVSAYRDYYLGEKMDIAKWAHSESPTWVLSKATWSHVK
tara:strand:+ start:593 stop:1099 length:507 start_codon:yes stop_codon:yes gene_type:complete